MHHGQVGSWEKEGYLSELGMKEIIMSLTSGVGS